MTFQRMLRVFSVAALAVLTFVALGPANQQHAPELVGRLNRSVGYFPFAVMFCIAWPGPLAVGAALAAFAVLLAGLPALMPDARPTTWRPSTVPPEWYRRLCSRSSSSEHASGFKSAGKHNSPPGLFKIRPAS
jgi:hypothetical protein